MKYILTAGGTGGHIYPALAILEEIKKDKNPGIGQFAEQKGSCERTEASFGIK